MLLTILSLTNTGLTLEEMRSFASISMEEWKMFKLIFKPLLIQHNQYYKIIKRSFKYYILQLVCDERPLLYLNEVNKDPGANKYLHQIHSELAKKIEKSPMCLRRLEEKFYHLHQSGFSFLLK